MIMYYHVILCNIMWSYVIVCIFVQYCVILYNVLQYHYFFGLNINILHLSLLVQVPERVWLVNTKYYKYDPNIMRPFFEVWLLLQTGLDQNQESSDAGNIRYFPTSSVVRRQSLHYSYLSRLRKKGNYHKI